MAALALGIVGAGIGWGISATATFLGMSYASIGWSVGSTLGSMIGGGGSTQKIEGPRLGDLKVSSATYGNPIPRVYSAFRVSGNMIWSKPILETRHATRSNAGGKGGGGKKVKQISYTYSQSFAMAVCEGEIVGLRRIWANGELIYNASASADSATLQASGQIAADITVYSGSEDQSPDSLIQADIGVADTPAYRGTAYVVFSNLQLAKYGNRTPNLEFEVVTVSSGSVTLKSTTTIGTGAYGVAVIVNGKYAYIASYTANTLQVWDVSDQTLPVLLSTASVAAPQAISIRDNLLFITGNIYRLTIWDLVDPTTPVQLSSSNISIQGGGHVHNGNYFYYFPSHTVMQVWDVSDPRVPVQTSSMVTANNGECFKYGDYFYMKSGISGWYLETISIWSVGTTAPTQLGTFTAGAGAGALVSGCLIWEDYLFVGIYLDNTVEVYSLADPLVPALIATISCSGTNPLKLQVNQSGSRLYVLSWGSNHIEEFDITDLTAAVSLGTVTTTTTPYSLHEAYGVLYTTQNTTLKIYNAGNSLAAVVTDICEHAGLTSADLDTTSLTDTVVGYAVTRGSARGHLQQLMQTYFFDAVESSGKIKFVTRGGSSAATIDDDDMAARNDDGAARDPLTITRAADMELPVEVAVSFPNVAAAYNISTQTAQRQTTSSSNKDSVSLAVAMSVTKGKQVADVALYNAWNCRTMLDLATGWKYAWLEPTDVVTITNGGRTYTARLTGEDSATGVWKWTAALEDSSTYTQDATAADSLTPDELLSVTPLTDLLLLDIPLLRDQDDGIGFYAAAAGAGAGWSGAQLYKSIDNGATWQEAGDGFLNPATMGTAISTLGDFTQNIFDESNTVSVYLTEGSLDSDTEINVLNGNNAALLGNEIIQFRTATLTAANTYTLSGLLRGRMGTEWARSTHTSSDRFVLLEETTTYLLESPSTEYNLARLYRGATFDSFLDDAEDTSFTHTAVARECYSPVHLGGGRDASLNITLNWIRRTRISGGWNDNSDVPLGEDSQSYEVEIYSSNTYVTLKRTISGLSAATTTYSAAEQTTDFGSTQATIYFIVYQVSATAGRGYPARGVI